MWLTCASTQVYSMCFFSTLSSYARMHVSFRRRIRDLGLPSFTLCSLFAVHLQLATAFCHVGELTLAPSSMQTAKF